MTALSPGQRASAAITREAGAIRCSREPGALAMGTYAAGTGRLGQRSVILRGQLRRRPVPVRVLAGAAAAAAARATGRAPVPVRVPAGAAAVGGGLAMAAAAPATVWAAATAAAPGAAAAAVVAVAGAGPAMVGLVRAAPVPAVPASAGRDRRVPGRRALRTPGKALLASGDDSLFPVKTRACGAISLRRHCPDQVLGVAFQPFDWPTSQPSRRLRSPGQFVRSSSLSRLADSINVPGKDEIG